MIVCVVDGSFHGPTEKLEVFLKILRLRRVWLGMDLEIQLRVERKVLPLYELYGAARLGWQLTGRLSEAPATKMKEVKMIIRIFNAEFFLSRTEQECQRIRNQNFRFGDDHIQPQIHV